MYQFSYGYKIIVSSAELLSFVKRKEVIFMMLGEDVEYAANVFKMDFFKGLGLVLKKIFEGLLWILFFPSIKMIFSASEILGFLSRENLRFRFEFVYHDLIFLFCGFCNWE